MDEIPDQSIDYVITSPPYNIGHCYGAYIDKIPDESYLHLMESVIQEISKKITLNGFLIIDITDCIVLESKILFSGEWLRNLCYKYDLILHQSCSYLLKMDDSDDFTKHVDSGIIERTDTFKTGHSIGDLILIFKTKDSIASIESMKLKHEYHTSPINEAFWSDEIIIDFLNSINCDGKKILDPFMGSGLIGIEAIKRGGFFYGYDINKEVINLFFQRVNESNI